MKPKKFFSYLGIAILIAGVAIWGIISNYYERQEIINGNTNPIAEVVMYKNAGCQCCDKWADYLERNGYSVTINESTAMASFKEQQNVPPAMGSCHTALIDGYVVEGHVPIEDINRLLANRPEAVGIAAPGMPASSPGMNTALNEPYDVYLFDREGNTYLFASH